MEDFSYFCIRTISFYHEQTDCFADGPVRRNNNCGTERKRHTYQGDSRDLLRGQGEDKQERQERQVAQGHAHHIQPSGGRERAALHRDVLGLLLRRVYH